LCLPPSYLATTLPDLLVKTLCTCPCVATGVKNYYKTYIQTVNL
jgi:hypothetical protein